MITILSPDGSHRATVTQVDVARVQVIITRTSNTRFPMVPVSTHTFTAPFHVVLDRVEELLLTAKE